MALFNSIRLPLTLFLPLGLQFAFEAKVATDRIEAVLLLDERRPSRLSPSFITNSKVEHKHGLALRNYSATWMPGSPAIITGINLQCRPGQLTAIVGPVGAGKSTILNSILGETEHLSGTMKIDGRVAFVPQESWVFTGTIRQNIILGAPFDMERYETTIRACCLRKDIDMMVHGDKTLAGDRGISLSGGQKARINLARAVYRDMDVYLLDDPLSAVDAQVSKLLFERCVRGLLRDKVVILVTHQLQHLHQADDVLLMRAGTVVANGTLDQLQRDHPTEFVDIVAAAQETEKSTRFENVRSSRESTTANESNDIDQPLLKQLSHTSEETYSMLPQRTTSNQSIHLSNNDYEPQIDETTISGSVSWSVYGSYLSQLCPNIALLIGLMALLILVQVQIVATDWWLNLWTSASEREQNQINVVEKRARRDVNNSLINIETMNRSRELSLNETLIDNESTTSWLHLSDFEYLYIYAIGCTVLLITAIARALSFRLAQVRASGRLHAQMFNAVVKSKMAFFDDNPVGRILNRFSKDTETMDQQMAFVFYDFLQGIIFFVSIVIVIGILNPLATLLTVPLAIIFLGLRQFYLASSRHVKRIEATSRSPIFTHVSAVLNGLTAIRAFNAQSAVMQDFHRAQNVYTSAFALTLTTARWFAGMIEFLVVVYIASISLTAVWLGPASTSDGSMALQLIYSMQLTGFLSWIVRQSAELETGMVSVERIIEYANLEPEEKKMHGMKIAADWPNDGHIEFRSMSLAYQDNDNVLKDISVDIPSGSKVAIVGRTGAGKSSLLRALFRLTEPTGQILIDNVDISHVELNRLRTSLSIIPQDPVLFIGSLRKNLDPFDEYDDDQLWQTLDQVQLKDAVTQLDGKLAQNMHEGGANFSVGQKQLVCLARALLRKSKILVIDEATANVDACTDALIQRALRAEFAQCTVLTIAHRLNTIMHCDKVMVLANGELIEFDTPLNLLKDDASLFHKMAQETGDENFKKLLMMAQSMA